MYATSLVLLSTLATLVTTNSISTMIQQRHLMAESDYSHPCVRECVEGEHRVCYYSMVVDTYTSMSVQCKDCPYNLTDCTAPGCIVGGGIVRPVITANRRVPGPAILVCENDTVIVDVTNALDLEAVTIHWHGIHQEGTPYMDGAPYITQCPIQAGESFRYQFSASPYGTHMWHGHVGYLDASGLFGPLVVRRQEPEYLMSLYDFDLPEHTITVWHWFNETDQSILPPILHTYRKVFGYGLLINGFASFRRFSSKENASQIITTPKAKFLVKQGKRYRFRIIDNSAIYCPVQVSIDNHTVYMVSSGTDSYQPLEVETFILNAGERFSFVLDAGEAIGCYWMRFRGIGDCGPKKSSTHGEAILCYEGANTEPESKPTYDQGRRKGKLFNPVQVFKGEEYSENELILMSDMSGLDAEPHNYNRTPDTTIYIQLHAPLYLEADAPGPWPQFNNITYQGPPFSMLTQPSLLTTYSGLCDDSPGPEYCLGYFCSCTLIKRIPLNALVEIVMVDVSIEREQDHPIHLHGYKFHVVAMGTIGDNVSLEYVKQLNEVNLINKTLVQAPVKDTVSVPNAGYTVIRFIAHNPGFWFLHCHISNHLMLGMAMVLQVGEVSEMADIPLNFPTCGNPLYNAAAQNHSRSGVNYYKPYNVLIFLLAGLSVSFRQLVGVTT